jgi:energy-coupling factor transporter ATP-binding protein EcfA2
MGSPPQRSTLATARRGNRNPHSYRFMSRIIGLTSENVKRLKAVNITPGDRNVVLIGGKNGNGKTSVLDSIAMALGGGDEIPDMPVRRGEKKAKIVLELDDLVIKRTFTAEGGTQLVVENKDGARYPKPQDMLDKLTGKLTFDPLEFMQLKPAARLESLKKIVGLDLSALDAKRKALYDERTLVNRQADQARAKAEFMPKHEGAPADEQSVTDIVAERDAAKEHNEKATGLERAMRDDDAALDRVRKTREAVTEEIMRLEARLLELRTNLDAVNAQEPALIDAAAASQKAFAEFQPIDLAPINQKLATAEQTNKQVRENKSRTAALLEAETIASKATKITQQIEAIDEEKGKLLAACEFPVPGLSFNETGVLFNGIPFDQASDAEKLRVSVAMGLAMNPKLKVLLVRNGSLLDNDSLALLTQLATEANAQVWVEMVSTDAAKCCVIIEDGSVREAEPAAAEEQAEPAFPSA